MIITSAQNEKIKELKKLMTSKSLVFLDNPKLIVEAVSAGHSVKYIIKRQGCTHKCDYGGEILEVSDNVFNIFSSTVSSQGLVGVVELKKNDIHKPKGSFLVLDGLQDPGNVGTLIRSALGANFLDIYFLNCVSASNDKVIRSSMGAIFKTNICEISRQEFIDNFKTWGKELYTCDMDGKSIYETQFSFGIGIVVGNEGNGVSVDIENISTGKIKIPMQNGLESLNAGVSGSIIMYEIANRN